MAVRLNWCTAKTSSHRSHLSLFRCTVPAVYDEDSGLESHDYPWEFEVQEYLNRLRLPAHPPEFVFLGYDDIGLAAVVEVNVSVLDMDCFIRALGIAHRVSGQGLGGEAVDIAHHVMRKYNEKSGYAVSARVDPDNWAAKSVFQSRGFRCVEMSGGFETWARKFD